MLHITRNQRIYVVSPYFNTGGPKTLHQLADILSKMGVETYIYYYDNHSDTMLFEDCSAKICHKIIDDLDSIIIIPETISNFMNGFSNACIVIWWLSLDYYFTQAAYGNTKCNMAQNRKTLPYVFFKSVVKWIISKDYAHLFFPMNRKKLNSCYHFYNCEYINHYLVKQNISDSKKHFLCGPLEQRFLNLDKSSIIKKKENIVAYNPSKIDFEYLKRIKREVEKLDNTIVFLPIQNMTRDEVIAGLLKSKVYIDFGYFPGPERMPREAAMLYCNIITSTSGSAKNDIDVPIPEKHKFDKKRKNVKTIANLIIDMTNRFSDYTEYQDRYREKVQTQILTFEETVREIFWE